MNENRTVLVVGATGMLGLEICRRLREQGRAVRGLVRQGSAKESMLRDLGVAPHAADLPQAVLGQSLPGDFVVRQDAPPPARVAAFTQLLSEATGRTWRSEVRPLEREVIVVSGTYAYHPPADTSREPSGGDGVRDVWRRGEGRRVYGV